MQKIIEEVLSTNRLSYVLYSKGLNTKAQVEKFRALKTKKLKQAFVVARKPKSELFFQTVFDEEKLVEEEAETVIFAVVRGPWVVLVFDGLPEEEIREEIFDEIVNGGELYLCAGCKEIIRSQRMKCDACKEAYLCTFCFVKIVMIHNGGCLECNGAFLAPEAKAFLEELVGIYKSNPRDLFTILQKKKKHLPPSLKNLEKVIKSALGEAKARGEKLDL